MQNVINFVVEYPNDCGELGLTLSQLGKYVTVEQASGQSESYGIRFEDRIMSVNNQNCVGKYPSDVVSYVQKYVNKDLVISFQRSIKPEETERFNLQLRSSLQNDSIFYEGSFLFRLGLNANQNFTEKHRYCLIIISRLIRIMRVNGPLLKYANDFKLIPYGIAIFWYNSAAVNTPYDAKPAGAQNLLPCLLEMRPGTNGFYIIRFICKKDILITSQERTKLFEIIDAMSSIFPRDISYMIKGIGAAEGSQSPLPTQTMNVENEESEPTIDFGEAENSLSNYNLSSTLNIPYPYRLIGYVKMMYQGSLLSGLKSFQENLNYLMETGYHPEQIVHSVTALFINLMSIVPPGMWDDDIRKLVQDIIVEISTHTGDYIRTTTVHPSGFCVVSTEPDVIEGVYYATREMFCDLPIFRSENGCTLYRQINNGQSTWILRHGNDPTFYYLHSTDIIPPRFSWQFSTGGSQKSWNVEVK